MGVLFTVWLVKCISQWSYVGVSVQIEIKQLLNIVDATEEAVIPCQNHLREESGLTCWKLGSAPVLPPTCILCSGGSKLQSILILQGGKMVSWKAMRLWGKGEISSTPVLPLIGSVRLGQEAGQMALWRKQVSQWETRSLLYVGHGRLSPSTLWTWSFFASSNFL